MISRDCVGPLAPMLTPSAHTPLLLLLQVIDRDSGPCSTITSKSNTSGAASRCRLHVALPKADKHYWRSLFEGGPERSHVEVGADRGCLHFNGSMGTEH
jgi:hypothetical protein